MEASKQPPRRLLEESGPSKSYGEGNKEIATQGTEGRHEKIDKQSLSYVLRSGLAGGFAGCAV